MASDEDDRPKAQTAHAIGQDLSMLAVAELEQRVALLSEEIERLRAEIAKKRASREAADRFFRS
ncbi:MAG TPA: DUF1192 domain-containing protein [Xanthobacteraceae bacterium]|nr:DUF1192 domain-containing protein [Xanthobacteraceae bacterium]